LDGSRTVRTWLSGTPDEAAELMKPFDARPMHAVAVSTVVNNARNKTPECLTPATAP
jgi:putative SOS response-associated peptidase YedK